MTDGPGLDSQIAASTVLGAGSFLTLERAVVKLSTGEELVRDIVRHPGAVAVLPVDGDRVWFIRQHRVAVGRDLDEIPAGKLDVDGEPVVEAARRELVEELGATADRMDHLVTIAPSPGYADEVIEIYVAQDLHFVERTPQGAEERHSQIFSIPVAEALDRITRGEIVDAKTLVAVLEWDRRSR